MNYVRKKIEEIIKVDHAGEYGAMRIYQGQLESFAKKGNFEVLPEIEKMKQQENEHLKFFNKELMDKEVLATIFLPIWHFVGYGIGYISAKMGKDFAMTCTEAIEEVINDHYLSQIQFLENTQSENNSEYNLELAKTLEKFRLEELEHKDHAFNYNHNSGLKKQPLRSKLNKMFGFAIKLGCKAAITISKKI